LVAEIQIRYRHYIVSEGGERRGRDESDEMWRNEKSERSRLLLREGDVSEQGNLSPRDTKSAIRSDGEPENGGKLNVIENFRVQARTNHSEM
jgi:hypothetical protein